MKTQTKEITAKVTAKVDVGKSSLDQFQATHQLDSAVGQIKESAQDALSANDSTLFAAVPTADASSPAVKEPALGSSGGSKQEAQAPAAPPSTPLWLLQAEVERLELALTSKLSADV